MDIKSQLSQRAYYSNHSREFQHYYDIYTTNKQKVDRIVIDSLQKGFSFSVVLQQLDQVWANSVNLEAQYRIENNEPLSTALDYFESYLCKVIRNILVFDQFNAVFPHV